MSIERHGGMPQSEYKEKPRGARLVERRQMDGKRVAHTTRYEYDDKGRVARETETYWRDSGIKGKEPFPLSTIARTYVYDDRGRLLMVGKRIEKIVGRAGGEEKLVHEGNLEYSYDGDSEKPLKETYERDGNVSSVAELQYDDAGRLARRKETSFYWGKPTEKEERFSYDEQGRLKERQEIDSNGDAYAYRIAYDKQGRVSKEERSYAGRKDEPFGVIDYAYSRDGRTTTATNLYSGEPVWTRVERRDEHGTVEESTHINFDKKQPAQQTNRYENVYES